MTPADRIAELREWFAQHTRHRNGNLLLGPADSDELVAILDENAALREELERWKRAADKESGIADTALARAEKAEREVALYRFAVTAWSDSSVGRSIAVHVHRALNGIVEDAS